MKNNYIIFNGNNSNEIEGLIIQELPEITKPKLRTNNIIIDGRDGDIVEKLGYASYTKQLSIGLNTKADIDEVMNFFTGEGKVIFSNEPDKVYDVLADDKVDYKRLVKFRQATVKFHVQPFKYLVDEAPFILNVTNQSSFKVSNQGYVDSKPVITLYGSGDIILSINGKSVCSIDIDDESVVIDSLNQEAYKGLVLKNRNMNGQFPMLKPGINEISWSGTGNITKIKVEPKSRWL